MMQKITDWLNGAGQYVAKISKSVYVFFILPTARYVNKREYLKIFLVFSLFFTVFCAMYFSLNTLISSDDHFFHFRFAYEMRTNGLLSSFYNFKSIYFTKIAQGSQYFIYYNFLFYLVIIPFTYIQPLVLGIKLYAVIAAALSFTVFYWCLGRFKVKYPFLWVLAILAITGLAPIVRLFLSRPYALTPALLLVFLYFLNKKNHWGVLIISFGYLFWHGATFFLPLGVALAYYVFERFYQGKGDWKNLAYCAGGTVGAVGLVYMMTPGFFLYIQDNIWGVFWDVIIGKKVNIAEGSELYPTDFFDFIRTNTYIFASLLVVASVETARYIRYKREGLNEQTGSYSYESYVVRTTLCFLCVGILLSVFVVSARFNDYFAAFVGLYIAISFDDIKNFVLISDRYVSRGLVIGGLIAVFYLCFSNGLSLYQSLGNGVLPDEWRKVGAWLDDNTKPGDIIFNTNWGWFTELYYYAPHDDYIIGLEPRLTYVYSPKLYWLWWHIGTDGYVCDTEICDAQQTAKVKALKGSQTEKKQWYVDQGNAIADVLLSDFHSRYLISTSDYSSLEYALDNSRRFERVLTDNAKYIYEVEATSTLAVK